MRDENGGDVEVLLAIAVMIGMYLSGRLIMTQRVARPRSAYPPYRAPYRDLHFEIQAVSRQMRDAIRRSSKSGRLDARLRGLLDRLYGLEMRAKQEREVRRALLIYRKSAAHVVSQIADHAAAEVLKNSLDELSSDYWDLHSAIRRALN